jgi:hypothetical protein
VAEGPGGSEAGMGDDRVNTTLNLESSIIYSIDFANTSNKGDM